ncbi:MAG: tRNA epoxyqueuosine(34) reductase QueG [Candidatus Omnitrophica bacterium]|nr:tRNA epoxyqueuosine(34) reductase QueG [Candidatus Omnitrophota bacterium]
MPRTVPIAQQIKLKALELGFDAVGIAGVGEDALDQSRFAEWVSQDYAGDMQYLARRTEGRPLQELLPGAQSVLSLVSAYPSEVQTSAPGPSARVARYAWERDYHKVLRTRLKALEACLPELAGRPVASRHYVDTGPILERSLAHRAGLGFFGKNTLLITRDFGSWVFVCEVLTDLDLEPDTPLTGTCGSCTRCLDICPTQAFTQPYQLDARKCISYLTIESRDPIPHALRPGLQDWVFGCDLCQEVCPYNQRKRLVRPAMSPAIQRAGPTLDLAQVLRIRTDEEFLETFAGTALMRAKRRGLLRSAAVVAGNLGDPALIPVLEELLELEEDPVIREHAEWAKSVIMRSGATR